MSNNQDHKLARDLADGRVFTSLGAVERNAIRSLVDDRDALLAHAEKLAEALKFYSRASRMPQASARSVMDSPMIELYTKYQMDLAQDDGAKAREALADWEDLSPPKK